VIATPIWLVVASSIALLSNIKYFYKKDSNRTLIRLIFSGLVFSGLLAFMAVQMYWVFQLRFLYEQSSYALKFQDDYRSEIKGTLNLTIISIQTFGSNFKNNAKDILESVSTASVGQIITYILGIIPFIDLILGLFSRIPTSSTLLSYFFGTYKSSYDIYTKVFYHSE